MSLLDELLKKLMESKNTPVQNDVPAGMLSMLSQNNQSTPKMDMSFLMRQPQAPQLPELEKYHGGSGIGKGIISGLLGDWFDERKTEKDKKTQEEELSKINEYLGGLETGGQGIPLRRDAMTSSSGLTGGPLKPDLKAEYLMQTPGVGPTADNLRKTGADIYQSILAAKGKVGTTAPDVFVSGDPNDPSKAQTMYVDENGVQHVVGSPRQQFADPKQTSDMEQKKLDALKDYRDKKLKLEQERINASKENARLRASAAEKRQKALEFKQANPNLLVNQKAIDDAEADHQKLVASVKNYKEVLKDYDQIDRHNPLDNAKLQTAYQSVTWNARAKNMLNTGVMNVGEYPMLNATVQDPTDFTPKGFRSKKELESQLDEFVNVSKIGLDALKKARSGQPDVSNGAPAAAPLDVKPLGKGRSGAEYIVINGKTYRKKVQ